MYCHYSLGKFTKVKEGDVFNDTNVELGEVFKLTRVEDGEVFKFTNVELGDVFKLTKVEDGELFKLINVKAIMSPSLSVYLYHNQPVALLVDLDTIYIFGLLFAF